MSAEKVLWSTPIPKRLARARIEASERIWFNIPPAKVWVYRKA